MYWSCQPMKRACSSCYWSQMEFCLESFFFLTVGKCHCQFPSVLPLLFYTCNNWLFLIYYCFLKVLHGLGFFGRGRGGNREKESCYELLSLVLLRGSMGNTIQVSTILPSNLLPSSNCGNTGKCKKRNWLKNNFNVFP